ncbi:MAG: hypothetical protein UY90_C0053G0007 [Candidatus Peregrinibacteria bacterium GW2011_GWA2_54_9]|nr:MAG: hypothetical protein UY90_C0053G0007 [Candidatus Peregrinibacteria bacterium GW2011_GWA2_54_9]
MLERLYSELNVFPFSIFHFPFHNSGTWTHETSETASLPVNAAMKDANAWSRN